MVTSAFALRPTMGNLGLTRFDGHLIDPVTFRGEVFDEQGEERKLEEGTALV